jgi:hypothetical protein
MWYRHSPEQRTSSGDGFRGFHLSIALHPGATRRRWRSVGDRERFQAMTVRNGAAGGHGQLGGLVRTLVAVVMAVGILTAGFGGTASAAATYGFWNVDDCFYTWAGPVDAFQKGTCETTDSARWGQNAAAFQLYHWDGQRWRFQGIYDRGTMDTPNGIFIVPFVSQQEEHLFIYDYADTAWYHVRMVLQSVQAVPVTPELETASGWRSLAEIRDPALDSMLTVWKSIQPTIIENP